MYRGLVKEMIVDPAKLDLLKEPFGILIKEDLVNRKSITEMLRSAFKIVTVGDTTTEKLIGFGIMPDISVIDGKEKRVVKTTKLDYKVDEVLKFKNNPGELGEDIISAIRNLASQKNTPDEYGTAISVDGKKDDDNKEDNKENKEGGDGSWNVNTQLVRESTMTTEQKTVNVGFMNKTVTDKPQNNGIHTIEDSASKKIRIAIDGEEDIVALPFLIYAPVGWVVCYGQPNEGLVIVQITEESKKRAKSIFNKVFL